MSKIFYAHHRFTTETNLIVRIKARDKAAAKKINENWCPGTKDKNVRVISKDIEQGEYTASFVRTENTFYD